MWPLTLANLKLETMMWKLGKVTVKKIDRQGFLIYLFHICWQACIQKQYKGNIDTKLNFRAEYHFKNFSIIYFLILIDNLSHLWGTE